ncbi:hypothetical protein RB213_008418, partial [Colletotrichum asianum]
RTSSKSFESFLCRSNLLPGKACWRVSDQKTKRRRPIRSCKALVKTPMGPTGDMHIIPKTEPQWVTRPSFAAAPMRIVETDLGSEDNTMNQSKPFSRRFFMS